MTARSKSGIFKPKLYSTTITSEEPDSFDQAVKNINWKKAMDDEYYALIKNKTWNLVYLPKTRT